jgi:hypothetical protein
VTPKIVLLVFELSLCRMLPHPSVLLLQSPGFATGNLVVQSSPDQGASISIDGRSFQQLTNATFVVSPGNHKVEVAGGPDSLQNCNGAKTKTVWVPQGGTATVTCVRSGWQ